MLAKHGITQETLAKIAGVSQSAVTRWKQGSIPRKDAVSRICNYYAIEWDDIMSEHKGIAAKEHGQVSNGFAPVPLLDKIAARDSIPMKEADDTREAPAKYKGDDENVFLLRVNDDSVNKVIPNGSFALISPRHKEPNEHDLFAVCMNGHCATIKHVKKLTNGYMLIPDSYDPTCRPQVFDYNEDDTSKITIIGKVVWACMPY